jgi:capsular polysaccharide export protein
MSLSSPDGPIILLQGPVSGFFGALAREMGALGFPALKVDFNFGDRVCDRCHDRVSYRGDMESLSAWYHALFRKRRPRAVVVFGDQRPVHRVARAVCAKANIPFYSFEEGYIRPDYVTLEVGGANALSTLFRRHVDIPETSQPAPPLSWGRNFFPMAARAVHYYIMLWLGLPFFARTVHHRDTNIFRETKVWIKAFAQKARRRDFENRFAETFAQENSGNYFLLALQKADDSQIHTHGRGWTGQKLVDVGIETFARAAPADCLLLVKQHPLDVGYCSYVGHIADAAVRHGVSKRVVFLRNGRPNSLLANTRGVVTINSTMGLAALAVTRPVLTLGNAFYARPGLAVDGRDGVLALEEFWRNPAPVDAAVENRFRRYVVNSTQINGDFYIRRSWPTLTAKAIRVLSRGGRPVFADSERAQPQSVPRTA